MNNGLLEYRAENKTLLYLLAIRLIEPLSVHEEYFHYILILHALFSLITSKMFSYWLDNLTTMYLIAI